MNEAIEQFRTQLGAAIDSVEFVKRALDRQVHETDRGRGPRLIFAAVHESAIGTKQTWASCTAHVRFRGKADMGFAVQMSAFDPKRTLLASSSTPSGRRKPLIWFASPGSCDDRSGLSGLARCGLVRYWARARWGARLDTNCLGSFNDLRGLLDLEMQHTFVEMSFNGSLFRLKR